MITTLLSPTIVAMVTVRASGAIGATIDSVSVGGEEGCGGGILGIDLRFWFSFRSNMKCVWMKVGNCVCSKTMVTI